MKTLLMIRHAKSGWENFKVSDFERPLSNTGNLEAPEMARRLLKKNIKIDLIVSSTALRTRQTSEHFCKTLSLDQDKIQWEDKLYHAAPSTIEQVITSIDSIHDTVAVICHNPGITEFVNTLDELVRIDDMPTCGVFAIATQIESWSDFAKAKKAFLFFDSPKNL